MALQTFQSFFSQPGGLFGPAVADPSLVRNISTSTRKALIFRDGTKKTGIGTFIPSTAISMDPPHYSQKQVPPAIREGMARIARLFPACDYDRGNCQAIRKDHRSNLLKVATVLVKHSCLQLDGKICKMTHDGKARPITVKEIAFTLDKEMSLSTVKRCLKSLRLAGLFESSHQEITSKGRGSIIVKCTEKALTPRFWQKLGLTDLFVEGVAWAKVHRPPIEEAKPFYRKSRQRPDKSAEKRTAMDLEILNCPNFKAKRARKCKTCSLVTRFTPEQMHLQCQKWQEIPGCGRRRSKKDSPPDRRE